MGGRSRRRRALHLGAVAALVLAAGCDGDDGPEPSSIELGEDARPGEPGDDDEPGDGEPGDDADEAAADEAAADDAATEDTSDQGADDVAEGHDGDGGPRIADLAAGGVVDLTVAEPGTWPVGNAGTVAFDLDRRDLVLIGIESAPGWSVEVEEEDDDEIEVVFRRDRERWRFSVERSGRHLEVEIDHRLDAAATGGYDLGGAGSFAFDVRNRRLVLTSLEVAEGWTIRDLDEDDDDIEIELRADDRRVDVEVELDDDRVELEIDYRVRSRIG